MKFVADASVASADPAGSGGAWFDPFMDLRLEELPAQASQLACTAISSLAFTCVKNTHKGLSARFLRTNGWDR